MSNFQRKAINPKTGEPELASYLDDHYGPHKYGVMFEDGEIYPREKIVEVERVRDETERIDLPQYETEYWRERLGEIAKHCRSHACNGVGTDETPPCVIRKLLGWKCCLSAGTPSIWEIKEPAPAVSFQFGDKVRRKSDGRIGIVVHNVAQPELGSGYHHIYWEDAVSDDYLWRDELEKVGDSE